MSFSYQTGPLSLETIWPISPTRGATTGTLTFKGKPAGRYEVRRIVSWFDDKFHSEVTANLLRAAMRAGKGGSDAYIEEWRRERSSLDTDADLGDIIAAEIERLITKLDEILP